jgi:hypothetical protein
VLVTYVGDVDPYFVLDAMDVKEVPAVAVNKRVDQEHIRSQLH